MQAAAGQPLKCPNPLLTTAHQTHFPMSTPCAPTLGPPPVQAVQGDQFNTFPGQLLDCLTD